jgi:uncharacterized protein (TIGR02266 family)
MITKDPKNILVADDSVFFRTKLSAILIEVGHKVTFASDGREVIKKLQEDPNGIDLVILDLQMPHIDGFGVLEWMKNNGCNDRFPTLAVSGVYEPGEVMDRLRSLGVKGLMTKGFTPEQVIHRINQMLFPQKVEDRVEPRAPISAPVDFTLGDETYTGFLLNISSTGLFLHTRIDLLPGSALKLKFSLPGSTRIYNAKGTVRWSTPPNTDKTLFGGAGIMFTSISDGDRQQLKHYVEKEIKNLVKDE